MLVLITGKPGVGKTTLLRALNHPQTVIMDEIVHDQLYAPGHPLVNLLGKEFGRIIYDDHGGIDRAKLGKIVLEKPILLKRLNAITAPFLQTYLESLTGFHLVEMGSYLSQEMFFKHLFQKVILITKKRLTISNKFTYLATRPRLLFENHKIKYDYKIINNDFALSLQKLAKIVAEIALATK